MTRLMVAELDGDGDLEGGWARIVDAARRDRPDLVVLPELPFGPWLAARPSVDPGVWVEAARVHAGWLERLDQLGAGAVVLTVPVVEDGRRFNEAIVWTSGGGVTGRRRKTYLPDEAGFFEASWYDRGPVDFAPLPSPLGPLGVPICTELWYSEHAADLADEGVAIIASPRATPSSSASRWEAAARVAATRAGAFLLSTNRTGRAGPDAVFDGGSVIVDPEGEVIARTTAEVPAVTVEVALDDAHAAKARYPRYVDRGPVGAGPPR